MNKFFILIVASLFLFAGVLSAQTKYSTLSNTRSQKTRKIEYGTASFYHDKFIGRQTSNGDIFSQTKLTAAHNSLPMGTWIRVTNMKNKKSVDVRVNDRLHKTNTRIVDLSSSAAKQLGLKGDSVVHVKIEVLNRKKGVAGEQRKQ